METYAVLLVDGGMWSDPALYGPFTSYQSARERVQSELPGAEPAEGEGEEPTRFEEGDDVALILPLAGGTDDIVRTELDGMLEARAEFIADDGPLAALDACADVVAVDRVRELFESAFAETGETGETGEST